MLKIHNINKNITLEFDNINYVLHEEDIGSIESTHYTSKALNQNGSYLTNTTLENREINITGYIVSDVPAEMNNKRKHLIELVNPLDRIYVIKNRLKVECKANSTVGFSSNYKDNNNYVCKFNISLFCANPFWNNINDLKSDIALWKPKLRFPVIIPKNRGVILGLKEPSLITNIVNNGDTEIGMRIEFRAKGALTNPSLFNINTREEFKVEKSMIAGEKIVVNTTFGNKRVEHFLNGTISNGFRYIKRGSTFLQLDIGDNLFRYNADTNIDNLEVTIYYNPNILEV
ncbi:MAG: phage tail family protein [Clostridium sp.]|uniref:phage tail family protein n=1 Tax=Clostridium sp. TaxID=1506 RepID=UPI002FC973F2